MDTTADLAQKARRRRLMAFLAALVLIAAAGRALFLTQIVGFHAPLRGDEADYHALAVSIASGSGYANDLGEPTAVRPPLWPLLLAGVYRLFGARPEAGRILQVLLGTIAVPLVYAVARRAFPRRRGAAAAAAGLTAVNPSLVFAGSYLLAENLYIAIVLVFFLVVPGDRREDASPVASLLSGAILGLGSLARPNLFPFALFAIAAVLLRGGGSTRRRAARAALVAAGLAAALAPWAMRNERVLGEPVLFTTHGGIAFYQGNNRAVLEEQSYRGGVAPLEALPGWKGILEREGEIARDREAWRLGKEFVRDNLASMPRMTLWKFVRFWRLTGEMGLSGVRSGWWWDKGRLLGRLASSFDAVFVYSIVAIPLFVAGLAVAGRDRLYGLLAGLVVVHTLMALVFFGSLRSRIPIEPAIAIFAGAAVAWIAARLGRGGNPDTAPFAG